MAKPKNVIIEDKQYSKLIFDLAKREEEINATRDIAKGYIKQRNPGLHKKEGCSSENITQKVNRLVNLGYATKEEKSHKKKKIHIVYSRIIQDFLNILLEKKKQKEAYMHLWLLSHMAETRLGLPLKLSFQNKIDSYFQLERKEVIDAIKNNPFFQNFLKQLFCNMQEEEGHTIKEVLEELTKGHIFVKAETIKIDNEQSKTRLTLLDIDIEEEIKSIKDDDAAREKLFEMLASSPFDLNGEYKFYYSQWHKHMKPKEKRDFLIFYLHLPVICSQLEKKLWFNNVFMHTTLKKMPLLEAIKDRGVKMGIKTMREEAKTPEEKKNAEDVINTYKTILKENKDKYAPKIEDKKELKINKNKWKNKKKGLTAPSH